MANNTDIRRKTAAERLSQLIDNYKLKPAEISKETGINRATLSRYLSGRNIPSDLNAQKLGELLHADPGWLQGRDDTESLYRLTSSYKALNDLGKSRVLEYMEVLRENDKFSETK
jgi:transcriptional regulator with XRE-family HTH domain